MPNYRQRDATDCGACCLGYIAARFGKVVPVARLRQLAGTGQQGTTVLGLVEAAGALGLRARAVKGSGDQIAGVPLPAIAHCLVADRSLHYVVLVKWGSKCAKVMDPATGHIETWDRGRFLAAWTGVLVLVAPDSSFEVGDHSARPVTRLWRLLRPHANELGQAFIGAVISTVLALAISVYVQKIVDCVIPDGNRPLLNLLGVAMLVVAAFKLLLGVTQSLLSMRVAQQIDANLILAYYDHLLRLPRQFFDSMRIGEITARVADAVKVRQFLNSALLSLLLNPLVIVFALAAMFVYSWQLALLSLALVPLNAAVYAASNQLNRGYQRNIMERIADLDAHLVESLSAQDVIRRFGLESRSSLGTEVRLVRLLRTTWRAGIGSLSCSTTATILTQGYLIVILWLGAGLVLDANLTPGELMSAYTLAGYLTGPMSALVGLNVTIQEALIATDRLFEIMDLELEKDPGAIEFTRVRGGDIRFENVSFKHAGRLTTLDRLSFCARKSRITALAGESGCGKSTALALVQRLYAPAAGTITIGGVEVGCFTLASLRQGIAVVPQQTTLLSGTVVENLVPGATEPDMDRLLDICREIGALGIIQALPQGFLSPLAENGGNLSGGQRQLLAIARALYRDSPVLLLDEPSSALDVGTEDLLLRALERRREAGTTILLAAHNPRVLRIADQVVTLGARRTAACEQAPMEPVGAIR